MHMAGWRKKLKIYHHFIITGIVQIKQHLDSKLFRMTAIQKADKKPMAKLIGVCGFGCGNLFSNINQTIIEFTINSLGQCTVVKDECHLMEFNEGLFELGDSQDKSSSTGEYTPNERLLAKERAYMDLNKSDCYYAESNNCETYMNYCFTGRAISYQSEIYKNRAPIADAFFDSLFKFARNMAVNFTKEAGEILIEQFIKDAIKSAGLLF
jgi:hypothetical protein